jgi:hypothetical protein
MKGARNLREPLENLRKTGKIKETEVARRVGRLFVEPRKTCK